MTSGEKILVNHDQGGFKEGSGISVRSSMAVSVVLPVYNQLALTRACLDSLRGTSEPFELCSRRQRVHRRHRRLLPDGGTPRPLAGTTAMPTTSAFMLALNQGATLAAGDVLCFLHNDTEMRDVSLAGPAARGHRGTRRRPGRALRRAAPASGRPLCRPHDRPHAGRQRQHARRQRGGGRGRRRLSHS